jgi:hypothetical protein
MQTGGLLQPDARFLSGHCRHCDVARRYSRAFGGDFRAECCIAASELRVPTLCFFGPLFRGEMLLRSL